MPAMAAYVTQTRNFLRITLDRNMANFLAWIVPGNYPIRIKGFSDSGTLCWRTCAAWARGVTRRTAAQTKSVRAVEKRAGSSAACAEKGARRCQRVTARIVRTSMKGCSREHRKKAQYALEDKF